MRGQCRDRPCVLLLHGFPELAYSWRKVILPLAAAGFHVIAPDQRGYGRTTGWDGDYDGDLASFGMLNLVRDAFGLVAALGYRTVAAVVGHDFGSPVAAWCTLIRPDVFRAVVLMSAPFAGPPPLPFNTAQQGTHGGASGASPATAVENIYAALAALKRPRKHYQWYYATREADANMRQCPQGLHAFLRAYYHMKSADWKHNTPFPLQAWSADELAKMPTYYIMDLDQGMAETVASEMPSAAEQGARIALHSNPSPAAPSMYRLCSLLARATGECISALATSSACRPAPARTCEAVICWTVPVTGCSKSSRNT